MLISTRSLTLPTISSNMSVVKYVSINVDDKV